MLDQSVVSAGRPQDEAIRNTVALAMQCEVWGYDRFWVSEHHSLPSLAGTAPEVLLAAMGVPRSFSTPTAMPQSVSRNKWWNCKLG